MLTKLAVGKRYCLWTLKDPSERNRLGYTSKIEMAGTDYLTLPTTNII